VCDLALGALPATPYVPAAVVFSDSRGDKTVVGVANDLPVRVGDSVVRLRGQSVLTFATENGPPGCRLVGLSGTLAAPATLLGLTLRAGHEVRWAGGDGEFVAGTLEGVQAVGKWRVRDNVEFSRSTKGELLLRGTLAAPADLEHWRLPPGTQLTVTPDEWSFATPKRGLAARARSAMKGANAGVGGVKVDQVREARRDPDGVYSFSSIDAPVKVAGFVLASLDWQPGVIDGALARAYHGGAIRLPKDTEVMLCAGRLQSASAGTGSLRIGNAYGTDIVAGTANTNPGNGVCAAAADGYWLQVNSLCHPHTGIPQPPPKSHWVFVDAKGNAPVASDAAFLREYASSPEEPCPSFDIGKRRP